VNSQADGLQKRRPNGVDLQKLTKKKRKKKKTKTNKTTRRKQGTSDPMQAQGSRNFMYSF